MRFNKQILFVILPIFCLVSSVYAETVGDIDGDDQISLVESIHALQVVAGTQVAEVEQKDLRVKSLFSSSLLGIATPIYWVKDHISILSKDRVSISFDNTSVALDQLLTEVSSGNLEAVHGYAGYHPIPAAALFASIPFGPEVIEYLAWIWQGNGLTLWQKLYDDNGYNVKVIPCGAGTAETGGWYKQPINSVNDFSGLKIRSCGLSAIALQNLGAITNCYGGSEIMSRFLDGSIDAAEFSTPAADSVNDFPSVATPMYNYFPGWHQPSLILELIINKDVWNELTAHQQMAIDMSCRAATAENIVYSESIQAQYILDNATNGVQNMYFPEDVLSALRTEMETVMATKSAADADFNTIYNDYKQFHDTYKTWLDLGFDPRR